jgi:cathepsin E
MLPTAPLPLFTFLFLAVCIAANPVVIHQGPVSLPLARRINATGSNDLVQKDQARAKNLVDVYQAKESGTLGHGAIVSVGVTNAGITYEASVGVGNPPTSCKSRWYEPHGISCLLLDALLIDTGSSNTWVGATRAYVKTKSSTQTSNDVVSFPPSHLWCGVNCSRCLFPVSL